MEKEGRSGVGLSELIRKQCEIIHYSRDMATKTGNKIISFSGGPLEPRCPNGCNLQSKRRPAQW